MAFSVNQSDILALGYLLEDVRMWRDDGLEAARSQVGTKTSYDLNLLIEWIAYTECIKKPTISDIISLMMPDVTGNTFSKAVSMILDGDIPDWLNAKEFKLASDSVRNIAMSRDREQNRRKQANELVSLASFYNFTNDVVEVVNVSLGESFWRYLADLGADYDRVRLHCLGINQRVVSRVNELRRTIPSLED